MRTLLRLWISVLLSAALAISILAKEAVLEEKIYVTLGDSFVPHWLLWIIPGIGVTLLGLLVMHLSSDLAKRLRKHGRLQFSQAQILIAQVILLGSFIVIIMGVFLVALPFTDSLFIRTPFRY